MKNHFDWLLEDTLEKSTDLFQWKEISRPTVYASTILNPQKKPLYVSGKSWEAIPKKATMRYARFQSSVVDIATIMIYPTHSILQMPVFAAEWVAIADSIHVIVLDIEPLTTNNIYSDNTLQKLQQLKTKWGLIFPVQKQMPEWFNEIASPFAIFSSSTTANITNLRKMYNDYLLVTISHIHQNWQEIESGDDHPKVQHYKLHHNQNSPARTIIKNENEPWLETFLSKYHFA